VQHEFPAAGAWDLQPAARLGWGLIAIVIAILALGVDRNFLIDQSNYLDNFAAAPGLDWLQQLISAVGSLQGFIVGVFSEEVLWQAWATLLGTLLDPASAVVLTVCVLNLLIVLAVMRLPNPAFPLVIWILVPVGFAVTGLLQLRQGLALAVLLYVSLRMNRPVLGTLIAATIHTTFALAIPFSMIAWLSGRRHLLALSLAVVVASATAYLGAVLFELFGGRRLEIYDVSQGETNSILYVFGGLLCALPSLHRLLTEPVADEAPAATRTLRNLVVIHIGVIAFTATSFFVFPLGAGRIGYLIMLLLIPILPTMHRRSSASGTIIFAALALYLVYVAVKTGIEGTYDIYFVG